MFLSSLKLIKKSPVNEYSDIRGKIYVKDKLYLA